MDYVKETLPLLDVSGSSAADINSVNGAGVAPWVMSICNGKGVASIVMLGSTCETLAFTIGSALAFGMIDGKEPVDVAIRGAGNVAVPWPG